MLLGPAYPRPRSPRIGVLLGPPTRPRRRRPRITVTLKVRPVGRPQVGPCAKRRRAYVCGLAFRNSFIACAIVRPAAWPLTSFARS